MRKIDEKKVKEIVKLRNEGYSIKATSDLVGVSQGTVVRYSKKGKVKVKQSRVAKPSVAKPSVAAEPLTTSEPLTMDLLPDFLSGYLDGLSVRFNVPRSQIDDIVISRLETKTNHCSGWASATWIFGGGLLLALLSHLS
jgi:hypothetical protein